MFVMVSLIFGEIQAEVSNSAELTERERRLRIELEATVRLEFLPAFVGGEVPSSCGGSNNDCSSSIAHSGAEQTWGGPPGPRPASGRLFDKLKTVRKNSLSVPEIDK